MWYTLGRVTLGCPRQRNPRTPPCGIHTVGFDAFSTLKTHATLCGYLVVDLSEDVLGGLVGCRVCLLELQLVVALQVLVHL